MYWLRPILFAAGLLLFGALIWMERRRPRRAAEGGTPRAERTEPTFDAQAHGRAGAGAGAGGERESPRPLPVIDWSTEAVAAGAAGDSNSDQGMVSVVTEVPPLPPTVALGELPPLVVDWPEEHARRIVTLRIVPAGPDRLAGRALRQGLTASGFRPGPFGIFHLPADDGRVILSAASLVRPGVLDPAAMDFQRYPGVNVFAVLPGPLDAELALQRLGQAALELAGRVTGRVQDDTGATFSAAGSGEWRRRILAAVGAVAAPARPAD